MKPKKTKSSAGSSGTGTPKVSSLQGESKSTATEVQLAKLLARLRHRPHHTHELRQCGISHPAGRVLNLMERGFLIESARVTTVDSDGFQHHGVALYSLIAEPNGQQPQ
ncbi:helix-turn-helix domain-containing protein [Variovorax boronicumulans]|uniref:helix-turn-helix domain-containing protein n=1 Tax=Variovorax boronicumulans TaxID=436515 RepID=UPI00339A8A3A